MKCLHPSVYAAQASCDHLSTDVRSFPAVAQCAGRTDEHRTMRECQRPCLGRPCHMLLQAALVLTAVVSV